ncbi:MAG: biotin/lipoate A/B protein ligase family protein [Smithellaceae bacterium]|jgi:lipoate-protein ligase A|nr:biotin/lipoate A/B protein ligase family protein [Smithellaceae bacterium]MDD3259915.1 biotin/lipoate A/B protein ligase family protein [Smithellaceae bacterium]MDD3849603.1 biotin/lipoate A/B protein ligase family protein [Smithellaceae bacterium]HOG12857.1 biotin/lipoate A/B protein ligase family protein [Smithellaceae bacterium]
MTWRLIPYRSYNAFQNMAIDEAIFRETLRNKRTPTLRFFGWRPAAVSIGYFQDAQKEIHADGCRSAGVDLVRRITGGKAVYHRDEVTYSLAAGSREGLFPDDIVRTYEMISSCLARGLAELGICASLAETGRKAGRAPCCFSEPAGKELVVDGRKICGSAQIRSHGGFLQHGSLLMTFDPAATASLIRSPSPPEQLRDRVVGLNELIPVPVSAERLCEALRKGFCDGLGVDFAPGELTQEEWALGARLAKKYESAAWTLERKKEGFPAG